MSPSGAKGSPSKGKHDDDIQPCPKKKKDGVMSKLLSLALSELPFMSIGCIAMLSSTMSNASFLRMIGKMVDASTDTKTSASSSTTHTPFVLLIICGSLSSFLRTTSLKRAETKIISKLQSSIFQSILQSPESTPLSTLEDDIPATAKIVTTSFASLFRNASSIAYSTFFMLKLNPGLFFLSSGMIPVIGSGAMMFHKFKKRLVECKRLKYLEIKDFVTERVQLLSCVRLHNREYDEMEAYDALLKSGDDITGRVDLAEGMFMGGIFGCTAAAVLGVVYCGGRSVARGEMSGGSLTSFASYSFMLGIGTSGLTKAMGEVRVGLGAARRVFEAVQKAHNLNVNRHDGDGDLLEIPAASGLVMDNVSFSYNESEPPILQNISFKLQRGKVTALVGKNGAGKSTIAKLLVGLLQPASGAIHITPSSTKTDKSSQIPLSSLNKTTQRYLIGLISQNPSLFNSTIRHNITYANPTATSSQIQKALDILHAESFVTDLNAPCGKNGSLFSGGQRQKLALARLLIQNPSLCMILDEPTNNLDQEGEDALKDLILWNRTLEPERRMGILLIAHRGDCLNYVDDVIVLDGGMIAETGSLDELKTKKGGLLEKILRDIGAEKIDQ